MYTPSALIRRLVFAGLCFMLCAKVFAQESQGQPIDHRVWSQHYWQKLAERGLVEVAKPAAMKSAVPAKPFAVAPGVPQDSRDVAVTSSPTVTQSENSIFVHPLEFNTILNSNNSTTWPVSTLFGASGFISEDGGVTWRGQASGTGGSNSGDPATAIDRSGRFFVGYIAADGGQGVARSLDRGRTWTHVQAATTRGASLLDKNHLWVDNSPSSPFNGNLYSSWTAFGGLNDAEIEFTRSTDGGLSWSTPVVISRNVNAGSHNQGVNIQTGPNGEVYVTWAIYDFFPADEIALGFALSRDGGASFEPARRIITNIRGIRSSGTNKNMRVASFPVMTVDNSNSPRRGTLYAVWANRGVPGVNTGSDIDGYLIKSTDNGATWSSPVKINQDAAGLGKNHFFQWISCDPTNGNLSTIYYDDRNVGFSDCETFVANSTDGGATWTDFRVSDVSFTPSPIPGLAGGYFGDYLGIMALNGKVYPCWTDNRDGRAMAYVSPFILEQDSIPPAPITDLSAGSPASNAITLLWTAHGDDGDSGRAAAYDIRYAFAPIDSAGFAAAAPVSNRLVPQLFGATETFTVRGLNFNTTYYFAVKVVDEQGNASAVSNSPSATTLGTPSLSFAPSFIADTLLTGADTTRILQLKNIASGGSTLDFTARVEDSTDAWLSVAPLSGSISTGDSLGLAVKFDATGLFGGSYSANILLTTNDPAHAQVRVPVFLLVIGAPDITLAPDFFDFDTVLVGDTLSLALVVSNPGTDTLNVGLATAPPYFVAPRQFAIPPQQRQTVSVTFMPTTVGTFTGTLFVTSNDPDEASLLVPLNGISLPPPEIEVAPLTLDESLYVGETRQQNFLISNTGQSDLTFELSFENAQVRITPLRSGKNSAVQSTGAELIDAKARAAFGAQLLELARAASAGLTFEVIREGENDTQAMTPAMVEKFRSQLQPYAQLVKRLNATAALPSIAVVGFNSSSLLSILLQMSNSVTDYTYTDVGDNFTLGSISSFDGVIVDERDARLTLAEAEALRDYANLGKPILMGMDDFDNLATNVQTVAYPIFGVSAAFDADFYFGVLNPNNPITQGLTSLDYFYSTDNDYFILSGADWIFSDPQGNYFGVSYDAVNRTALIGESLYSVAVNSANNLLLLSNAIDWMISGQLGWVTLGKTTNVVAPGSTDTIAVMFNAANLRGGDYTADLVVKNNDPDEKILRVPVHLLITNAPDLTAAPDTLDFGEVYIGTKDSLFVTVRNEGTFDLLITSAVAAPSVFTVTPPYAGIDAGEKENFKVRFAPNAPGPITGTLTLNNNDPDENPAVITLIGQGVTPPVVAVAPDSFVFNLITGDSASAPMTISNNGGSTLNFTVRDVVTSGAGLAGGQYLFWTQEYQSGPDTLFRCNLDGTDIRAIYVTDVISGFGSIAYHPGEGRIYSAEYYEGRIFSVNVDGSDFRVLVTGLYTPFDIALDINAGHMYWTEYQTGVIRRANLDGSGVTIVVQSMLPGANGAAAAREQKPALKPTFAKMNSAAAALYGPWALDLDLQNGKIYWSEPYAYRIGRANLDGTGVETVPVNANFPIGMKLDVAGGKIYFTDGGDYTFKRANLDGSNTEVLLQPPSSYFIDFELDISAQKFYWTDYILDQVLRANFDGSAVTPIVTRPAFGSDGPFALGVSGGRDWLKEDPSEGSITAGASSEVQVKVNAIALLGGAYRGTIFINSNDPITPVAQVAVILQVTGVPLVEATPDTVDFKQVFVGFPQRALLTIANTGTQDLNVTDLQINPAVFSFSDSTSFTLPPNAKKELALVFIPDAAQSYRGTLTIVSNATNHPSLSIPLFGEGIVAPNIAVRPDTLRDSLKTGETATQIVTISNTGGSDLNFELTIQNQNASLAARPARNREVIVPDDRLHRLPTTTPTQQSQAAVRASAVAQAEKNFLIIDHGKDKTFFNGYSFDVISEFNLDVLTLSDLEKYDAIYFEPDWSRYANLTNNMPKMAAYAEQGGVLVINIAGNIGDGFNIDPLGTDFASHNGNSGGRTHENESIVATDHPYITGAPFGGALLNTSDFDRWNSTDHGHLFNYPASSQVVLRNTQEAAWLQYPLKNGKVIVTTLTYGWGGQGARGNPLMNLVDYAWYLSTISNVSWLSIAPTSGTVSAGNELALTATFDASGLDGGLHSAKVLFTSNDPLHNPLEVPAFLQVTGAPVIVLSDSGLFFGPVFLGGSKTQTLTVSNEGTDTLRVSNIAAGTSFFTAVPTVFKLAPEQEQLVTVRFAPTALGEVSDQLTISSNAANLPQAFVALSGSGIAPPVIAVAPDSITFLLDTDQTGTEVLTITNNGGSPLTFEIHDEEANAAALAAAGAGEKLYWTNVGGSFPPTQIRRSNLDGSEVETIFSGTGNVRGLAIDDQHDRVYWCDSFRREVYSSTLAGDSVKALVSNLNFPLDIALDVPNGKMYWTDLNNGTISRANLDGTEVKVLIVGMANQFTDSEEDVQRAAALANNANANAVLNGPFGLALDLQNGKIYWTELFGGRIGRANLDGSSVETFLFASSPRGVRVDAAGGKLYFLESGTDRVKRANLADGSNVETLVTLPSAALLELLELDLRAQKMYWTDFGLDNIQRASFNGSGLEVVQQSPNSIDSYGIAVASAGWLSEVPPRGTVAPGASASVAVTADPKGLSTGNYAANIFIASNDPVDSVTVVPVRLRVRSSDVLIAVADTTNGVPNDTVSVPVTLDFSSPIALNGLQAALKLSNPSLVFVGFTPGPIVPGGLSVQAPAADSLSISFTGAAGQYLNQSGLLATLQLQVASNATPGQVTSLRFFSLSAVDSAGNSPSFAGKNGLFIARKAPEVSGNVKYARVSGGGNAAKPVAGLSAVLSRNGVVLQEQVTNSTGNYALLGILPRTNYRVELHRQSGGLGSAVTPTDALLAFNAYLGTITLSGSQSLAADVDGDLAIAPGDALTIFNRFLGVINQYPVEDWRAFPASYAIDTNAEAWKSAPDGIEYPVLNSDQLNQDYVALVRGDVDLNWATAAGAANALITNTQNNESGAGAVIFQFAEARAFAGTDKIVLPIRLSGTALERGLYAFGGEVQYSAEQLEITAVHWGEVVPQQEFRTSYALTQESVSAEESGATSTQKLLGRLRFGGFASATNAIRHSGVLLELEARISGNLLAGTALSVQLCEASAATGAGSPATQAGASFEAAHVTVQQNAQLMLAPPASFALHSNYPNPFNPTTEIRYQLPEPATVTLVIYNTLGQRVRTLVSSEKQVGGYYRVTWDGRNEMQKVVTAGVYFYHLDAQAASTKFQRTRKMMMLK